MTPPEDVILWKVPHLAVENTAGEMYYLNIVNQFIGCIERILVVQIVRGAVGIVKDCDACDAGDGVVVGFSILWVSLYKLLALISNNLPGKYSAVPSRK